MSSSSVGEKRDRDGNIISNTRTLGTSSSVPGRVIPGTPAASSTSSSVPRRVIPGTPAASSTSSSVPRRVIPGTPAASSTSSSVLRRVKSETPAAKSPPAMADLLQKIQKEETEKIDNERRTEILKASQNIIEQFMGYKNQVDIIIDKINQTIVSYMNIENNYNNLINTIDTLNKEDISLHNYDHKLKEYNKINNLFKPDLFVDKLNVILNDITYINNQNIAVIFENIRNVFNQYNEFATRNTEFINKRNDLQTYLNNLQSDYNDIARRLPIIETIKALINIINDNKLNYSNILNNINTRLDTIYQQIRNDNFDAAIVDSQLYHSSLDDVPPNDIPLNDIIDHTYRLDYPGNVYPTDAKLRNSYNHYIQNYIENSYPNSIINTFKYGTNPKTPLVSKGIHYINCAYSYIQDNLAFINNIYTNNGGDHNYYIIDGMNIMNNIDFINTFFGLIAGIVYSLNSSRVDNAFKNLHTVHNDPKQFTHSNKIIIIEEILPILFQQISIDRTTANMQAHVYPPHPPRHPRNFMADFNDNFDNHRKKMAGVSIRSTLEPILQRLPAEDIPNKNIFIITYHKDRTPPREIISNACNIYLLPIGGCYFDDSYTSDKIVYRKNRYNLFEKNILGGKTRKHGKKQRKTKKKTTRTKKFNKKILNKIIGGDRVLPEKNESDDHIIMYIYLYLLYQPNMYNKVGIYSRDSYKWLIQSDHDELINALDTNAYRKRINNSTGVLSSTQLNRNNISIFRDIKYVEFIINLYPLVSQQSIRIILNSQKQTHNDPRISVNGEYNINVFLNNLYNSFNIGLLK
jgi:hypothetical protein